LFFILVLQPTKGPYKTRICTSTGSVQWPQDAADRHRHYF